MGFFVSMKWFRFYSDAINNPKVQSLSPELFKFWVNILCVTSQCDGVLPTCDEIAFYLRVTAAYVNDSLQHLIDVNLVDKGKELKPHNWDKRQYKSDTSAERTRKYRENKRMKSDEKRDVTSTVTATPSDTDTDTDTEIYKKHSSADAERKKSAVEVLNFLNRKAQKNFEPVKANLDLIMARLKEGSTLDDCRMVIAAKEREWGSDPEKKVWLRPKTLFNRTNFAQYKGELEPEEKTNG